MMISVKESKLKSEVLKEFNYSFGDVFIFRSFVVSEIKDGVSLNWSEHASHIVNDVSNFLGTNGDDIIYISNRINSYSVEALDWLRFFRGNYFLRGYYVVSESPSSKISLMVENLFFKDTIKRFNTLYAAVNWAKKGTI